MKFTLTFDCDNAAFENDLRVESVAILAEVTERVEAGHTAGNVRDSNGNTVGSWSFTPGNWGQA